MQENAQWQQLLTNINSEDLVIKFVVLLRIMIIFAFYCFINCLIDLSTYQFQQRVSIFYRSQCAFQNLFPKQMYSKYQRSRDLITILFTKIEDKRKKNLEILKSLGKKKLLLKLQMLIKFKSCGKKQLRTVKNSIVAGSKSC